MTFADLLYKFFAWIYNNKQSILASLVTVLAFIQANDQLRNLLTTDGYAWLMFGSGLLMALFARSSTGGLVSKVMPPSVPPAVPGKGEGGFIRASMLGLLLAVGTVGVVALPGCAALGVQAPEGFNEKAVAGYSGISAAAVTIGTLLDAGKITPAEAREFHTQMSALKTGLDVAVTAYGDGALADADTRLQAVILGLTALQAALAAKEA